MTQSIVSHRGSDAVPATVLGQGPARIPTGGKIRAGTKTLSRAAAENPQARTIYEQGVGVGVGIDGDGADTHAAGGPDDTAGDFSAIGNEDLGEHAQSPIQFGWRLSRKAAMPSCASGVARRWAMRWAVSSTRLSLIG